MSAERAEAAALQLLAAIAKAEGVDLGKNNAGWSKQEILDA